MKLYVFPLKGNGSGIFFVDTCQNLHQRGFTRTVLPHQGMHFALFHFKADMVQRMHTRERFINFFHR